MSDSRDPKAVLRADVTNLPDDADRTAYVAHLTQVAERFLRPEHRSRILPA